MIARLPVAQTIISKIPESQPGLDPEMCEMIQDLRTILSPKTGPNKGQSHSS